jgi:hypothetical protein
MNEIKNAPKASTEAAPAQELPSMTGPGAEPPPSRQLVRSTLIAAAIASVLLVTAVLPAEYGVDPTGIGRVLGLTQMGEMKMSLAKEAAANRPGGSKIVESLSGPPTKVAPGSTMPTGATPAERVPSTPTSDSPSKSDVTKVTLRPNESKEVKLAMRKGARASYSWSTSGGGVNYDLHADPPSGGPYHSYGKGKGARADEGEIVAEFDGLHGWYWRNRTDEDVTVTLETKGDYQEIKELK